MGWFGSKDTKTGRTTTITAAGMRIDLTDHSAVNRIAATKQGWQHEAWNYRDLIGELGSALRFRANALAKVAFIIAEVSDTEDEPIRADAENCKLDPVVAKAAQDALNRLPWRKGLSFAGVLDTCFSVAGEAWLHGQSRPDGTERWTVRSTDEIQPMGGDRLGVVEVPGRTPVPIDPKADVLLRLWVEHPRYKMLADSPLRAMRGVCEDIVLIGRELRAAARSRIASNGVWMIPDSMSMVTRTGIEPSDAGEDVFAAQLEAAMLSPIVNEGDPGGVVPVVVRAAIDDIKAASQGFLRFERETSADLISKLDNALKRMGEILDIPPQVITGLGDVNHWNAYIVDAQTWTNHLEPGVRVQVDTLTEAYLRPILTLPTTKGGYGLTAQQAATVQIWFDAGRVTENANRSADAQAAYNMGIIGPKAARRDMAFEESDAPTDEELKIMMALKVNPDPTSASALMQQAFHLPPPPPNPVVQGQPGAVQHAIPSGQPATPRPMPPRTALPPGQPPAPAGVRTASGATHPQGVLDSVPPLKIVTGDHLAEIDRDLRDRLLVAADDAVTAAVEKAAKRLASATQGKIPAAEHAAHRGAELAAWLGPERIAELGVAEDVLLAAAFTYLSGKFTSWTTQAVKQAVQVASAYYGLPLVAAAELSRRLIARIPAAWNHLEATLRRRALATLFGKHGTEQPKGEAVDSIVHPGDIRGSLAIVGGTEASSIGDNGESINGQPLGGVALGGDLVAELDRRLTRVGYEWRYGITRGRHAHFWPHQALDGRRFTDWDDPVLQTTSDFSWCGEHYKPGDHRGCMCDYIPAWALGPEGAEAQRLERAIAEPESPSMRNERLLAEIDNAAGRTGTSAQRTVAQREFILEQQRRWLANARRAS